ERYELATTGFDLDQVPHRRPARDASVADGIEADQALRAQGPLEDIVERLLPRGRARQPLPAEMPGRQLIGFQHADPPADRDEPPEERELQGALRGLAARPRVSLFLQHVIID